MEDEVGILILPRYHVHPELSHEEHLIRVVRNCPVPARPRFLDPVRQVPDEVKEEVRVRDRDDLVSYLDEDAEARAREQIQFLHNSSHQVLRFDRGVNQESLTVKSVDHVLLTGWLKLRVVR